MANKLLPTRQRDGWQLPRVHGLLSALARTNPAVRPVSHGLDARPPGPPHGQCTRTTQLKPAHHGKPVAPAVRVHKALEASAPPTAHPFDHVLAGWTCRAVGATGHPHRARPWAAGSSCGRAARARTVCRRDRAVPRPAGRRQD